MFSITILNLTWAIFEGVFFFGTLGVALTCAARSVRLSARFKWCLFIGWFVAMNVWGIAIGYPGMLLGFLF